MRPITCLYGVSRSHSDLDYCNNVNITHCIDYNVQLFNQTQPPLRMCMHIYTRIHFRFVDKVPKRTVFMAALRSRCGHYILQLVSIFFFFPRLFSADVHHTAKHGVALVQI